MCIYKYIYNNKNNNTTTNNNNNNIVTPLLVLPNRAHNFSAGASLQHKAILRTVRALAQPFSSYLTGLETGKAKRIRRLCMLEDVFRTVPIW